MALSIYNTLGYFYFAFMSTVLVIIMRIQWQLIFFLIFFSVDRRITQLQQLCNTYFRSKNLIVTGKKISLGNKVKFLVQLHYQWFVQNPKVPRYVIMLQTNKVTLFRNLNSQIYFTKRVSCERSR